MTYIPAACGGELCYCGQPAVRKVEEVIFWDDPIMADTGPMGDLPAEMRGRHPLTAYVCAEHFAQIMGALGAQSVGLSTPPKQQE